MAILRQIWKKAKGIQNGFKITTSTMTDARVLMLPKRMSVARRIMRNLKVEIKTIKIGDRNTIFFPQQNKNKQY